MTKSAFHLINPMHQHINQCHLCLLAGKLMQGVTLEHVLDDIRDNTTADRRSLVERKDLHNIMRSFGLDKVEQLHVDDATSVDLWVKENIPLRPTSPSALRLRPTSPSTRLEV